MAVSSATRRCQLGRETTPGTAVAATTYWRGPASMQDMTQVVTVQEDVGRYSPQGRTYVPMIGAQVSMPSQVATFEQLLHIFEAGIQTVTPSGTEAPYTYTYTFPTSDTEPTLQTYTIEYGDAEDAEEAEYCFVESFELTGAPDEAVMVTATWRGRQVTQGITFTADLTLPAVEEILFDQGVLYIDDSGGSIGASQVSNSFLEFSFSVTTGWVATTTGDGELYFTFPKLTRPEITLSITAEHTSDWDSAGEKAEWVAENFRLVRIQFDGTSSRYLRLDMAGKWLTFGVIEDRDGNSVLTGEMSVEESSTDSLWCEIEISCTLASVP